MNKDIVYAVEQDLSIDEFIAVLNSSTLAERRPVGDRKRIGSMLKYSNLIITARYNGAIVGVARSVTDFVYCTYLSDLAVDEVWQHKGIGKELIYRTKQASSEAKLILLAAPKAVSYYPKIGMLNHPHCYYLDELSEK